MVVGFLMINLLIDIVKAALEVVAPWLTVVVQDL